jgi:hypothetical protein
MIVLVIILAIAVVALAARNLYLRTSRPARPVAAGPRRILFPFAANGLAPRALDAALRLAAAEEATLVPVFLARVPLILALDAPLPRQSQVAIPLQEAIEQRAVAFGVPVDARIERGRSYRHALRQAIEHERFDRIVIAAGAGTGFDAGDVAWLLDNAPGEIVVLRPDPVRDVTAPRRAVRSRRRRPLAARQPAATT